MNLKKYDFKRLFVQFFKYGMVGILGFSTYAIINFILIKSWGISAEISIIFAIIGGGTTNYLLNKRFTFKNDCDNIAAQIVTFVIFNIFISLLLTQLILFIIHSKYKLIADDFYSTIAAAIIMMPVNFGMAKLIIFNRRVLK